MVIRSSYKKILNPFKLEENACSTLLPNRYQGDAVAAGQFVLSEET
jgi:hypothetical protein